MHDKPTAIAKVLKLRALGKQDNPEGETARGTAAYLMRKYGITESDLEEKLAPVVLARLNAPEWECKIARSVCSYLETPGARVRETDRGKLTYVECDGGDAGERAKSMVLVLVKGSDSLHYDKDLMRGYAAGITLALDDAKRKAAPMPKKPEPRKKGTVLPDPAAGMPAPITYTGAIPYNTEQFELGVRLGREAAQRVLRSR